MALKTEHWILGAILVILAYYIFVMVPQITPPINNQSGLYGGGVQYQCPAWNGQCTLQIEDQCCPDCIDVRMCGGSESNPYNCMAKYCTAAGSWCQPNWNQTSGLFDCGCAPIPQGNPN